MLVYGDVECFENASEKYAAIAAMLSRLAEGREHEAGIERHGALVTAFIAASELVQGLIDTTFQEHGADTRSDIHERGMEWLLALARCVLRSWRSGLTGDIPPEALVPKPLRFDPSLLLRTRRAEGYAFYALYPECYLQAALRSGLGEKTRVIGLRSIGVGLCALVAAALDAPPPVTLRPVGHPFRREVRVDSALRAALTADKDAAFAIVDEGPGLSGSSFGAVADWLEASGIPRECIHFFPSHEGEPGPQASSRHRRRWQSAQRHVVPSDELLLRPSFSPRLAGWIETVLGPLEQPLEDVSGGLWRMRRSADRACWPAVDQRHERRKFLTRAGGASWLVKFVGLGEIGSRKYEQARRLHAAGFTPEVAGHVHGFLVERWHDDACLLDRAVIPRDALVERIGRYLAFRARRLPADGYRGASLSKLRHMACYNAGQALGQGPAAALERLLARPDRLEGHVRRASTDNRMHAWEWLVCGSRIIKTDAVDHSASHDLAGHQDIAWDIAGAAVELVLSEEETARLCDVVEHESGHPVIPEILHFMRPCYAAFQMGAHAMAAEACGEEEEAERLRRGAARYAAFLPGAHS